jgi:phosphohistidine phosphatase
VDLYLIRHADAVPLGNGEAQNDSERPLTEDGEEQARHLAAGLQRKGIRLSKVLTSPLLRARQTAEKMLKDWGNPAPELVVCDQLSPGTKRRKVARILRELQGESIALVGHQPDLGDLAAWLIGSRKAQVDFAKGGVAHVVCHDDPGKGSGTLVWLVTHDWLCL